MTDQISQAEVQAWLAKGPGIVDVLEAEAFAATERARELKAYAKRMRKMLPKPARGRPRKDQP